MNIEKTIRSRSTELTDYTAQNLSTIVQIPSLSGKEEAVIDNLGELCEQAGLDEVRVDGLGNLVARVGKGPRVLAIDAHVDTVGTGDLAQWELPPHSGHLTSFFFSRLTIFSVLFLHLPHSNSRSSQSKSSDISRISTAPFSSASAVSLAP